MAEQPKDSKVNDKDCGGMRDCAVDDLCIIGKLSRKIYLNKAKSKDSILMQAGSFNHVVSETSRLN